MENEFFFPPYVGELYGKPESAFSGIRVMALGNSHYCDKRHPSLPSQRHNYPQNTRIRCCKKCIHYLENGVCPNASLNDSMESTGWTVDGARSHIAWCNGEVYKGAQPYYNRALSNFSKIFGTTSKKEIAKLVKSIAHYNMLQAAVPSNKSEGIDSELEPSKRLVIKAIYKICPDIILIWGYKQILRHMLDEFKHTSENILWTPFEKNNHCGYLNLNGYCIKLICMFHPSDNWHDPNHIKAKETIETYAPELFSNLNLDLKVGEI